MTATLFDNLAMTGTGRPKGLERFHLAHARKNIYTQALIEIREGKKRSHWMWFVFPKMTTREGGSEMSRYYAIADKAEAVAYLADPVLSMRLAACTAALLRHRRLMFSDIDQGKLRACMTLFAQVAKDPTLLNAVLEKWFDGPDPKTLERLKAEEEGTMARFWEKYRKAPAPATPPVSPEDDDYAQPWSRKRIEYFMRGYPISDRARREIVDTWIADGERSRDAGWESHADSIMYEGR